MRKLHAFFYWATVICMVTLQGWLCHETIVDRGYPPISETAIWKFNFSPFLVFVPSLFGNRITRLRGLLVFAFATAFLYHMAHPIQDSVPSKGHLYGFFGLMQLFFWPFLFFSIVTTPLTMALLYFPERVLGDLGRMALGLPVTSDHPPLSSIFRIANAKTTFTPQNPRPPI